MSKTDNGNSDERNIYAKYKKQLFCEMLEAIVIQF